MDGSHYFPDQEKPVGNAGRGLGSFLDANNTDRCHNHLSQNDRPLKVLDISNSSCFTEEKNWSPEKEDEWSKVT